MKEEFDLSEKISEHSGDNFKEEYLMKEDVKEFIRRLKEEIENQEYKNSITETIDEILLKIDKLAGDKLTMENKEEFNLSKKRIKIHNFPEKETYDYAEEDVKEFIRLLKEELAEYFVNETIGIRIALIKKLDKLAGNNLI